MIVVVVLPCELTGYTFVLQVIKIILSLERTRHLILRGTLAGINIGGYAKYRYFAYCPVR